MTRASPCCATRSTAAWRTRATAASSERRIPGSRSSTTTTAGARTSSACSSIAPGRRTADFVYTAGLAVAAADGRVLYRVPRVTARGAATRHPQPQPRLRGLVQRARAHRAPAPSRRLRRIASPHRGLGPVDPPDRGRAAGRVPRAAGGVHRARDEHAPDRDRHRRRARAVCCAPSTRTAACRAGSIPSSSVAGSPRDRLTRGDPGAPRSRMPSRPCATAAGPMRGARWARALRAVGLRRVAPRVRLRRLRAGTGYRSAHSSEAMASSNELGSSSNSSVRPSNRRFGSRRDRPARCTETVGVAGGAGRGGDALVGASVWIGDRA